MRPNIKFRGFDKFFLVMFTILGQPFLFLSHVFLFRNWFQVYIALRDTWVRDSGTPGSCFFHIVCPSFEGSSAQIPGHWERTVSPLSFTRGVGFLSKSNAGKCHCCYTADHSWISVTGFWFPCFMWSRLWIYAAIPVVFDCKQIQVMEKSKEVLVLTGLVVECVWLILHSPFIFLHVPVLFGLCMRGLIKVNQKLSPFFFPARVYRGWPYVKR